MARKKAATETGQAASKPTWEVIFSDEFKANELAGMDREQRKAFNDAHDGSEVWRAAFAFDPARNAIVLVAGDKQGRDEDQFYKQLLKKANKRYDKHLESLKPAKK